VSAGLCHWAWNLVRELHPPEGWTILRTSDVIPASRRWMNGACRRCLAKVRFGAIAARPRRRFHDAGPGLSLRGRVRIRGGAAIRP